MAITSEQLARFRGIAGLFGISGFQKINDASVTVVGCGGVGSWCIESLVRSGLGHLRIFDHDTVAIHNINRQSHALTSSIGHKKVEAFAKRLLDINPHLDLEIHSEFIDKNNIKELFPLEMASYMWVVDAIDSLDSKVAFINYLKRNKFKFFVAGGAGGKDDPTKIKVGDLAKTTQDALLRNVRYKLRKEYGFTQGEDTKFGIKCVYIEQQPVYPKHVNNAEELELLRPTFDNGNITFGAFMPATSTVGLTIARQIIMGILGKK